MADARKPETIVTRDDVKAKLNEIDNVINETTSSAKDMVKIVIGVAVVVGLAIAFTSGRRRALRPKTIVSFTKVR